MTTDSINVPASEVACHLVDIPKLVAQAFAISRTEATRQVKAGAVEVIEATNGVIDYQKTAGVREPLMVYSKEIVTYLRWSHRWRKLRFD